MREFAVKTNPLAGVDTPAVWAMPGAGPLRHSITATTPGATRRDMTKPDFCTGILHCAGDVLQLCQPACRNLQTACAVTIAQPHLLQRRRAHGIL